MSKERSNLLNIILDHNTFIQQIRVNEMVVKKVIARKKKRMEREVKLILGGIGAIALRLGGIIGVLVVDFDDQGIEVKEEEIIPEEEGPEKIGT